MRSGRCMSKGNTRNQHLFIQVLMFVTFSIYLFIVSLSLHATTIAGDLAPYGATDGQINSADLVILKRFVFGELTPTADELLAADVAPLGSPDGILNGADVSVLTRAVLGGITLPALPDTTPPAPADTSLITVTDLGSGNVSITGQTNSVEADATVTVMNLDNGTTTITTANSDGSFSLTIAGSSNNVFSIKLADSSSNESPSVAMGIGDILQLTITSPLNGATIDDDSVSVTGTFSGLANAAITVNGQVACINGANFYASNVPLQTGNNTLEITATTSDGVTITQSISVNSTGPAPIQVKAAPECGFAPLTTDFVITNNSANTITNIEADFDNDAIIDFSTTDPNAAITHTYNTVGIYQANITVTDNLGTQHVSNHIIVVTDITNMDAMLRGIYTGMLDRLRVGAIEGALNALSGEINNKYRNVFNALQPNLSTIVNQLGTLQTGTIGTNLAEYAVVRNESGTDRAYLIYFIRGTNGVWRIGGM